jgi:polyisoprenoid-binding protein YceI
MSSRGPRRPLRWAIAAVVVVAVLAVAGPYIFFHLVEGSAPAPLSLKASAAPSASSSASSTQGSSDSVAGSWQADSGSRVGYRVQEVLFGQSHTAVGRSSSVTGQMVITGTTVNTASFTVKMVTIHTDSSQRDAQFDGRIMDVAAYPTGTFTLTKPIHLAALPALGVARTYTATGNLALHGQTRSVTFPLKAERTASGIDVAGSIPVLFSKWHIPNPSFTGFVTTQNHGILEFLLDLRKA